MRVEEAKSFLTQALYKCQGSYPVSNAPGCPSHGVPTAARARGRPEQLSGSFMASCSSRCGSNRYVVSKVGRLLLR